jgi:hypothetical protein
MTPTRRSRPGRKPIARLSKPSFTLDVGGVKIHRHGFSDKEVKPRVLDTAATACDRRSGVLSA